jgi:ribosomal-protein-alanine N-acetyltransferase
MDVEDRTEKAYEIGYIINKDYRRKGYASEAVNAIINDFFLKDGAKFITAGVFSFNKKSMHMLEKLGFVKVGITHNAMNHCKYGLIDMINYYKIL